RRARRPAAAPLAPAEPSRPRPGQPRQRVKFAMVAAGHHLTLERSSFTMPELGSFLLFESCQDFSLETSREELLVLGLDLPDSGKNLAPVGHNEIRIPREPHTHIYVLGVCEATQVLYSQGGVQ